MVKKLLIYNSGGGIGDSIQLIPLILSLENLFQKSEIYYLGAHENHYSGKLKEYNIKIKNLNLGLKYFGFRWWHLIAAKRNFLKLKLDKFDIIIDCQSKLRNTVILKQIPSKAFFSKTFNDIFCFGLKKTAKDFYDVADHLLFDSKAPATFKNALPGGNAISFDWQLLRHANIPLPWMLAGGLNINNIAKATISSGATTLDVSSGVERIPGVKDLNLISKFLNAVKAIENPKP